MNAVNSNDGKNDSKRKIEIYRSWKAQTTVVLMMMETVVKIDLFLAL